MSSKNNVGKFHKESNKNPCFKPIAQYWGNIDWFDLIISNYPVLELKFDGTKDNLSLVSIVDSMSIETDIDFEDAASWILKRALKFDYYAAREMFTGKIAWDPQIQYVCRVMALLICFWKNPDILHALEKVDRMIECLLITEDELLAQSATLNRFPC